MNDVFEKTFDFVGNDMKTGHLVAALALAWMAKKIVEKVPSLVKKVSINPKMLVPVVFIFATTLLAFNIGELNFETVYVVANNEFSIPKPVSWGMIGTSVGVMLCSLVYAVENM